MVGDNLKEALSSSSSKPRKVLLKLIDTKRDGRLDEPFANRTVKK